VCETWVLETNSKAVSSSVLGRELMCTKRCLESELKHVSKYDLEVNHYHIICYAKYMKLKEL
jgi:hypothetical protein